MSGCEGEGRGASDRARHLRIELQNSEFCGHQTGSFAAANGVFGAAKQRLNYCKTPVLRLQNACFEGEKLEFKHEF